MRPQKPRARAKLARLIVQSDLAGMTATVGSHRFGPLIDTGFMLRPDRVAMDSDRGVLRYDTRNTAVAAPEHDLLDRFIALADASDAEIGDFARRFGVLGVEVFLEPGLYEEKLSEWRYWATRARAALSVAASLHQQQPVDGEDWRTLEPFTAEQWESILSSNPAISISERRRYVERNCLADVLNIFITISRVQPVVLLVEDQFGDHVHQSDRTR